ncbi:MAG: response regulator transcription factor [Mariprofundaceae bacterium]
MNNAISVHLVDDHEIVRAGFRYLLEDYPRIKVVAESSEGQIAIRDYARTKADIVLMDISMQGMGGLDATAHILAKYPEANIIILSMQGREAAIRALEAGAKGFLSKSSAASEMITAINSVLKGHTYIDHATAQEIAVYQMNGADHTPIKALSAREYEIFTHLANAVSIQDIATRCHLSPKTVRSHKAHIMLKIGAENMIDFVKIAIQSGVIHEL